MSKILLTGANGFVGQALMQMLNARNIDFRAVVRTGSNIEHDDVFYIDALSSQTNWDGAFENVSTLIHLAGMSGDNGLGDINEINVNATTHLATQAKQAGVEHFIFMSSSKVYRDELALSGVILNETQTPNPACTYGQSKHVAEQKIQSILPNSTIIRPPLVYGNNAKGNFAMLIKLVKKLPFLPFGLVNNKRSMISVSNLCDFIILCVNNPKARGEAFVICDDEAYSIKQLTNIIGESVGKKVMQLPIPPICMKLGAKLVGKSNMANQLLGNYEMDASKAKKALNWTPLNTLADELKGAQHD